MSTFLTLTGSSMINDDSSQQTESHSSQSRHTPHLHQSQFVRSKRSVVAETLELPRRSVPLQQQEDVESSRASGARVRGSGSSIGKRVVVPNGMILSHHTRTFFIDNESQTRRGLLHSERLVRVRHFQFDCTRKQIPIALHPWR